MREPAETQGPSVCCSKCVRGACQASLLAPSSPREGRCYPPTVPVEVQELPGARVGFRPVDVPRWHSQGCPGHGPTCLCRGCAEGSPCPSSSALAGQGLDHTAMWSLFPQEPGRSFQTSWAASERWLEGQLSWPALGDLEGDTRTPGGRGGSTHLVAQCPGAGQPPLAPLPL